MPQTHPKQCCSTKQWCSVAKKLFGSASFSKSRSSFGLQGTNERRRAAKNEEIIKRLPSSSTIFGLYSPMREDIEEGKGKPIYYCDYCYSSLTLLQFSYGQQPREVEGEKHSTLLKWHCIILAFEINQDSNGNLDEWVSFLAELTLWSHATYFKLKNPATVSLALFWQIL